MFSNLTDQVKLPRPLWLSLSNSDISFFPRHQSSLITLFFINICTFLSMVPTCQMWQIQHLKIFRCSFNIYMSIIFINIYNFYLSSRGIDISQRASKFISLNLAKLAVFPSVDIVKKTNPKTSRTWTQARDNDKLEEENLVKLSLFPSVAAWILSKRQIQIQSQRQQYKHKDNHKDDKDII